MSLYQNERVSIPPHSVRIPSGKSVYIYYTVRSSRNEKGQSVNDRVSIGRLDQKTGQLIPNRNYYELFQDQFPMQEESFIRSAGVYKVFHAVADEIGLSQLIRKHFPGEADQILTVAQYMISEGNVMYYLPDWQDEVMNCCREKLTGPGISRLFSQIDAETRIRFMNEWVRKRKDSEFIAYDVTSISTTGRGIDLAEYGYNRDHEKLRQINFGMYYGEESMLPLYYRIYPGSIPDRAHLRYMAEDTGLLSMKHIRFVMDRGFYSAENLTYLTGRGCRFLIALPLSLKYVRELILKNRDEVMNRSEYYIGAGKPYGRTFECCELGFRMNVHLYYDPDKAVSDGRAVYEAVDKAERELEEMTAPPKKSLRYDRYFYINVSKEGKLAFRKNSRAIDSELKFCGFFAIADTDFRLSPDQALTIYRNRDVIEKSFDNLKNDLDMRRMHIHSEETMEGKAFVAFISLIVRSRMLSLLSPYMAKHDFTFEKVLRELDKVKYILSGNHLIGYRLLNPPTKTQREILETLQLPEDTFAAASR